MTLDLDNRLEPVPALHLPGYGDCFKGFLVAVWGNLREAVTEEFDTNITHSSSTEWPIEKLIIFTKQTAAISLTASSITRGRVGVIDLNEGNG